MSDERCPHGQWPENCWPCDRAEIERLRRELADAYALLHRTEDEKSALRRELAEARGALAIALNTEGDHSPTCECRICRMASELTEARTLLREARELLREARDEMTAQYDAEDALAFVRRIDAFLTRCPIDSDAST